MKRFSFTKPYSRYSRMDTPGSLLHKIEQCILYHQATKKETSQCVIKWYILQSNPISKMLEMEWGILPNFIRVSGILLESCPLGDQYLTKENFTLLRLTSRKSARMIRGRDSRNRVRRESCSIMENSLNGRNGNRQGRILRAADWRCVGCGNPSSIQGLGVHKNVFLRPDQELRPPELKSPSRGRADQKSRRLVPGALPKGWQ